MSTVANGEKTGSPFASPELTVSLVFEGKGPPSGSGAEPITQHSGDQFVWTNIAGPWPSPVVGFRISRGGKDLAAVSSARPYLLDQKHGGPDQILFQISIEQMVAIDRTNHLAYLDERNRDFYVQFAERDGVLRPRLTPEFLETLELTLRTLGDRTSDFVEANNFVDDVFALAQQSRKEMPPLPEISYD